MTTHRISAGLLARFAFALCVIFSLAAQAATSVTLAWDASGSEGVTEYSLYYGTSSGVYPTNLTVGSEVTTATVTGLEAGETYYFAVTAKNSLGVESEYSGEVSYSIPTLNVAPVALASVVSAVEDQGVGIALAGTDADGNALGYTVVTSPAHGTLSGTSPNLTYMPAANFSGADSFSFVVNDGTVDSAPAVVSINVAPVNDAPVASSHNVTLAEDAAAIIVLGGSDVEGSALTYAVVSQPVKGTLSGTAPNLTYTPAANFSGADSFSFTVNDGTADSDPAVISINVSPVNDVPVANTLNVTLAEDTAAVIVLGGSDVEGSVLTYAVLSQPMHGTLGGTAPNLTYTPASGFVGSDSFTFKVTDGTADSAPATVAIDVTAATGVPTGASVTLAWDASGSEDVVQYCLYYGTNSGAYTTNLTVGSEVTTATVTGLEAGETYYFAVTAKNSLGVESEYSAEVSYSIPALNVAPIALASVVSAVEDQGVGIALAGTDADGNALGYTVVTPPAHGTLSGTSPNLTYMPAANFSGADSFSFVVNDGTVDSAPAVVSIDIIPVNDVPTLAALPNLIYEQGAALQTVTLTGISSGAANESQTLTVSAVSSNPALIPAPGIGYTSPSTIGSLTFKPAINLAGTAIITVTVNDGATANSLATRSFTVTVTPPSQPPTIAIVSLTNGANFAVPTRINLSASINANGHAITKVQFLADSNLIGEASSEPYSFSWDCEGSGSCTVIARVMYDADSTLDSAPVTINLNELPAPWETLDVGNVSILGSVVESKNVFTVAGAGNLGDTADDLRFVYQPLSADGTITVLIDSVQSTNLNARVGVMVRESLTGGSKYAFMGLSPGGTLRWQCRSQTSGTMDTTSVSLRGGTDRDVWVRLVRNADKLYGYRSTDGKRWSRIGIATLPMASNIYVGLACASGDSSTLQSAIFKSPTVTP